MKRFLKQWWLSLLFLAGYPMVFYLWLWLPDTTMVFIVTMVAVFTAIVGIFSAGATGYFRGKTEAFMYVCIVFDISAEATCILHPKLGAVHEGHDFWWCTLAFALVIGGYRWWRLRSYESVETASHVTH